MLTYKHKEYIWDVHSWNNLRTRDFCSTRVLVFSLIVRLKCVSLYTPKISVNVFIKVRLSFHHVPSTINTLLFFYDC